MGYLEDTGEYMGENLMDCANCLYYKQSIVDKDRGICRVKPPQFKHWYDSTGNGYWPKISKSDWCGEFSWAILRD